MADIPYAAGEMVRHVLCHVGIDCTGIEFCPPPLALPLLILFVGGIMLSCDALVEGGVLKFEYLFSGFKYKFVHLLVVSLIHTALYMLTSWISGQIFDFGELPNMDSAAIAQAIRNGSLSVEQVVLFFMIDMLVFMPAMMAVWFAPALTVLQDVRPLQAIKMSFCACMTNIPAFIVYTLSYALIICASSIPSGFVLGILLSVFPNMPLLMPVFLLIFSLIFLILTMIGYYTSYCDVWMPSDMELE